MALADPPGLARAIAQEMQKVHLDGIVLRQMVIPDYQTFVVKAAESKTDAHYAVCLAILAAYGNANRLPELLRALYSASDGKVQFQRLLEDALTSVNAPVDKREALLRERDYFALGADVTRFGVEILPRICCIVTEYTDPIKGKVTGSGTGCLVGPDLVLTAMHVFDSVIADRGIDQVPSACAIYFDHEVSEPIRSPADHPQGTIRVELHANWLVASSPGWNLDGTVAQPSAAEVTTMTACLDCALIRLKEPVGRHVVPDAAIKGAGRTRRWVKVAEPIALSVDHRVIIPQHPGGMGRRVDWGRHHRMFGGNTRFHYDTGTAPGTSGAPCFDRTLGLLGVHNATYAPIILQPDQWNQGIYLAPLQGLLSPHLLNVEDPVEHSLWNVDPAPKGIRAVLGRQPMLEWLDHANSTEEALSRRTRVYAAVTSVPGTGGRFTVEIVQAFCRQRTEDEVIVLGIQDELMPETLPELVRVLFERLGVPPDAMSGMPPRPSVDLPAGDGDKTSRWSSIVIPEWFGSEVEKYRVQEVDRREVARQIVARSRLLGEKIPTDIQKLADSKVPDRGVATHWRRAWLVIHQSKLTTGIDADTAPAASLDPDVANFISAVAGLRSEDTPLPAPLTRLRWVFVGPRPDFLPGSGIVTEELDQLTYGADEAAFMLKNAFASRNSIPRDDHTDKIVRGVRIADGMGAPERMSAVQSILSLLLPDMLP